MIVGLTVIGAVVIGASILWITYAIGSMICVLHFNAKFKACATYECKQLAHKDTQNAMLLGGFWPATLKRWNVDYEKEVHSK